MEALKRRMNVFFYGILAGAAIAFGGILYLAARTLIPSDFIVSPNLIGALLFPVGLLLVCYFKFNLYTGKIGIAFRNKKIDKKGLNVFEWLAWILLGNAVGAIALGLVIYLLGLIFPEWSYFMLAQSVAQSRAMSFTFLGFFNMMLRSVFCGMLVYIAIYLFNNLPTEFGKVAGVVTAIAFFVYAGFQHCIANMFYLAAAGLWNAITLVGLLLCILGNSAGALLLDLFVKYE